MLVYRVEDEWGNGPYTRPDSNLILVFGAGTHCDERHPTNTSEGILHCFSWRCGFDSLSKVYDWFGDVYRDWLEDNGFMISVYYIEEEYFENGEIKPNVSRGKIQLCFNRDKAVLKEKLIIEE